VSSSSYTAADVQAAGGRAKLLPGVPGSRAWVKLVPATRSVDPRTSAARRPWVVAQVLRGELVGRGGVMVG
jgi:hypothetical protein